MDQPSTFWRKITFDLKFYNQRTCHVGSPIKDISDKHTLKKKFLPLNSFSRKSTRGCALPKCQSVSRKRKIENIGWRLHARQRKVTAVMWVWSLAWELPHATGTSPKQNKSKFNLRFGNSHCDSAGYGLVSMRMRVGIPGLAQWV